MPASRFGGWRYSGGPSISGRPNEAVSENRRTPGKFGFRVNATVAQTQNERDPTEGVREHALQRAFARARDEAILKRTNAVPKPDADYYRALADRLELLLSDMERVGTPPEDDLVRRLRLLLDEARRNIDG